MSESKNNLLNNLEMESVRVDRNEDMKTNKKTFSFEEDLPDTGNNSLVTSC